MKNWILLVLCAITVFACSSDDSGNSQDPQPQSLDFFPLNADSYWTFNNEGMETTMDSIYVSGTETVAGNSYTNLNGQEPVTGFMARVLSDNLVRTANGQLIVQGSLGVPVEGFPEISLPLDDVILFDTNQQGGVVLSTVANQIEETINEIPLVIDYVLTTTNGTTFLNSDNTAGSITAELTLNLSVVAMFDIGGISLPIDVLAAQDVLIATTTYDSSSGMSSSTVVVEYELEDLGVIGDGLPFPPEFAEEVLTTRLNFFIGE